MRQDSIKERKDSIYIAAITQPNRNETQPSSKAKMRCKKAKMETAMTQSSRSIYPSIAVLKRGSPIYGTTIKQQTKQKEIPAIRNCSKPKKNQNFYLLQQSRGL